GCYRPPRRSPLLLAMADRLVIDPILLFVLHALATRNLPGRASLVELAVQRPVAECFVTILAVARVPVIDDHVHVHEGTPDAGAAFRLVGLLGEPPASSLL